MRRELLILVALMLLFCISPVSAYDSESPQSITFSETLPDDVLFFPDNESHGSGYAESFVGVGDWSGYGTEGADTFTSDGDLGTVVYADADNSDYWQTSVSLGVITGHYIEVYAKYNTSAYGSKVSWVLIKGGLVGAGGSSVEGGVVSASGASWQTNKAIITTTETITGIAFYCGDATGPYEVEFDYLRVSPSDEMGLQHDFSTTTGISSSDGGTISSDGDNVTLTADADGATFIIVADTTATASKISTTYYPFLHLEITGGSSTWTLEQYDGSAYATLQSAITLTTGAKRFNMQALDTYVEKWRITLSNDGTLIADFLQAYSIANFTLTLTSDTIDDYLYVSDGTLYSHVSTGYIEADHDPAIDINTHYGWNMDTSAGTPEIDFYNGAWIGYTTVTEDAFVFITVTTVTDFRLKFTDNANIISLLFLDLTMQEINIFNELFLSTELWGYFGPLGLVIIGYLLTKKDRSLGIFMFIVDCLVIAHYLSLLDATPAYWWHIIILLFGVIQCTIQLIDR